MLDLFRNQSSFLSLGALVYRGVFVKQRGHMLDETLAILRYIGVVVNQMLYQFSPCSLLAHLPYMALYLNKKNLLFFFYLFERDRARQRRV